jgi:SAM-dependent MidA family methyltransferase
LQDRIQLAQQVRQLTLPGEMGERFRVMALAADYDQPLRGFAWRDMRERL